jgi:hypothetical protein
MNLEWLKIFSKEPKIEEVEEKRKESQMSGLDWIQKDSQVVKNMLDSSPRIIMEQLTERHTIDEIEMHKHELERGYNMARGNQLNMFNQEPVEGSSRPLVYDLGQLTDYVYNQKITCKTERQRMRQRFDHYVPKFSNVERIIITHNGADAAKYGKEETRYSFISVEVLRDFKNLVIKNNPNFEADTKFHKKDKVLINHNIQNLEGGFFTLQQLFRLAFNNPNLPYSYVSDPC